MKLRCRLGLELVVLAALMAAPLAPASAQPSAGDAFTRGREALLSGDYDVACAHFEAAIALEETPGLRLNLGYCEEKRGRLLEAWRQYQRALELLPAQDARRAATQQRSSDLTSSSLATILLIGPAGGAAIEARLDGAPTKLGVLDVIAPGPHQVTFVPPGAGAARVVTIEATAGQFLRIELDAEAGAELGSAEPAKAQREWSPAQAVQATAPATANGWLQRGLGIGAAGVGLTSVVVGAVFGVRALDKRSESDARCPVVEGEERCSAAGVRLNEEAKTAALAADILLGVGGGLTALGVVLILTAPRAATDRQASPASVSLCPTPSGAALLGTFQ